MKKIFFLILLMALVLTGCSKEDKKPEAGPGLLPGTSDHFLCSHHCTIINGQEECQC